MFAKFISIIIVRLAILIVFVFLAVIPYGTELVDAFQTCIDTGSWQLMSLVKPFFYMVLWGVGGGVLNFILVTFFIKSMFR